MDNPKQTRSSPHLSYSFSHVPIPQLTPDELLLPKEKLIYIK
jgi:hypothetical protein